MARLFAQGRLEGDGQDGPSFNNETTIRTFYSFVIPADTLRDGDLMRWHLASEITAYAAGTYTAKIFVNGVEAADSTGLPSGPSIQGFDFNQPSVKFVGGDPAAVRFWDANSALDVSGVDSTADITVEYRCNFNTLNAGNTHRAFHGYMGYS